MNVPEPGPNLFPNTQGVNGSGGNLHNADGANGGVNNEFNNSVPGKNLLGSYLNRKAKELTKQPEDQDVAHLNGAQNNETVNNSERVSTSEELRDNSNRVKCEIFLTKISESEGLLILKIGQNVFNAYVDAGGKVIEKNFKVEFGNLIEQVLESEKDQIKSFLENKETKKSKSITIATYTTKDLVEMREIAEENLMSEGPTIEALPKTKVLSADQNLAVSFLSLIDKANNDSNIKLIKPRNATGTIVRNIFFEFCMKVAAFFHLENRFTRNNGATRKLQKLLSDQIQNFNSLQVIDTARDGNCMLWSALISAFGPEVVEKNRSYIRNYVIPWLRNQIANALENGSYGLTKNLDRANALRRNFGMGAESIRPEEMGVVAESLGRNLFLISDVDTAGRSYTGYAFTSDGGRIEIGQGELGLGNPDVIRALNDDIAIFSFNRHARAIVGNGREISMLENDIQSNSVINDSSSIGTGNANSPNTGNPGLEPGDIPDGFEVISNDPPNDEGQL